MHGHNFIEIKRVRKTNSLGYQYQKASLSSFVIPHKNSYFHYGALPFFFGCI